MPADEPAVMDCEQEASTRHYLGVGHGYGVIVPEEVVLLAIFDADTHGSEKSTVSPMAFDKDQLKKDNMSLARRKYTSLSCFHERVIEPGEFGRKGKLVGVAMAEASVIRSLTVAIKEAEPPGDRRQVCLLDLVLEGDDDGHATLGYAESQSTVPQKRKNALREKIHNDLALAFGPIRPLDAIPFES